MLRITFSALFGLALVLAAPLGASAENPVDRKAPEAVVAANEDAVVLPAPARSNENDEAKEPNRSARGSSQSAAEFRFTNPYAFPVQTLPLALPSVTTFSF